MNRFFIMWNWQELRQMYKGKYKICGGMIFPACLSLLVCLQDRFLDKHEALIVYALAFLIIVMSSTIIFFIYHGIFKSQRYRRFMWFKSPFAESGNSGHLPGLSPVEAGIVMSVDIPRLLAVCLVGLIKHGNIRIEKLDPLKVKVLDNAAPSPFWKMLLDAVKEDGTLNLTGMLCALDSLYNDLKRRIDSYGVKDTVIFYLDKVDKSWKKLKESDFGYRKEVVAREEFAWLFLHERAGDKFESTFEEAQAWPNIGPVVKVTRYIMNRVITSEQILEHAANSPKGIFSNRKYRKDILNWAKYHLNTYSVFPKWHAESMNETSRDARARQAEKLERILLHFNALNKSK